MCMTGCTGSKVKVRDPLFSSEQKMRKGPECTAGVWPQGGSRGLWLSCHSNTGPKEETFSCAGSASPGSESVRFWGWLKCLMSTPGGGHACFIGYCFLALTCGEDCNTSISSPFHWVVVVGGCHALVYICVSHYTFIVPFANQSVFCI